MAMNRRELITRGAAGLGIVATGNLTDVFGASLAGAGPKGAPGQGKGLGAGPGYGELVPDPAGLLDLPPGFRYSIVSEEGQRLTGSAGVIPGRFDGTGSFAGPDKSVYLVRNSEYGSAYPAANPVVDGPMSAVYDPVAPGGTTTVHVDKHGNTVAEFVSLAGTASNCGGGITPWGTWLTCEEDESKAGDSGQTKDHGFVFEIDPANPSNTSGEPITGMGRFPHEAVCIDPRTGTCYLTEDASGPLGLVYRYEPDDTTPAYGALAKGGELSAMRCSDGGTHVENLAAYTVPGTTLSVDWVAVPDQLAASLSTRKQFTDDQVTRSRKYEGTWWGNGRAYIVCSFSSVSGLPKHTGQVWSFDPLSDSLTLEVYLAPDDVDRPGDSPDNICVSPYGGLIMAEDGDNTQYLLSVDDRRPDRRPRPQRPRWSLRELERVHRRDLLARRQDVVRQHPGARDHLRHHRSLRPHRAPLTNRFPAGAGPSSGRCRLRPPGPRARSSDGAWSPC